MSSNRKRSAIKKANEETEYIKQKLLLAEHHASVMETFAKVIAVKHAEKEIELHELKLKYCPETLTDKDHEHYQKNKKDIEEFKNPPKPEPIPQYVFAEEEYHETSNLVTANN